MQTLVSDKSKILQILSNLLRNAKESVLQDPKPDKKEINIRVHTISQSQVAIVIKDNGTGFDKENHHRIFSFGFTTKKNGHGFGLHSSALTAKELGGSLQAYSLGAGLGAEFTLTLPYVRPQNTKTSEGHLS